MIARKDIFDVVALTTGHFTASLATFRANRPPDEGVQLRHDCWAGRLPHGVKSEVLFDACDSPGYKFHASRQYGMRYAFCREVRPSRTDLPQWDHDQVIGRLLLLSRFIRPTTMSLQYSARMFFDGDLLTQIVPGPTQGLGAFAYVVAKDDWRDWLSVTELEDLGRLSSMFLPDAPGRVRQARKHIDQAFHAYYLDQRFASLVTAFESLLKVSEYQATRQFAVRAPALAAHLGYDLTAAEAKVMYRDRSAFVHGEAVSFTEMSDDIIEQYNRFERVIRLALLRASTESEFAALFASADTVLASFGA